MAKPRVPKKTIGAKELVSTPTTLPNIESGLTATTAAPNPAVEARKTEAKPEPRRIAGKPEIVRSESRANLVPISLDEEIRRLAYSLSERRGFEPGHENEDWLAAEHEVRQRYHQHSA